MQISTKKKIFKLDNKDENFGFSKGLKRHQLVNRRAETNSFFLIKTTLEHDKLTRLHGWIDKIHMADYQSDYNPVSEAKFLVKATLGGE